MHLSEARIQTGDTFLFQGKAPHSRLIEHHSDSIYSHAAIALVIPCYPERRVCCIEALEARGVRCYPMDRYLEECAVEHCQVDWYAVKAHPDGPIPSAAASFALDQLGLDYVSLGQLAWSFGWIASTFRRVLRRPVNLNPHRWFCSELVAACYLKAGWPVVADPAEVPPGDVALFPWLSFQAALAA
jgi:hypothetical protein